MEQKNCRMKSPQAVAVFSAFVLGLLIHGFGLVNVLHNNDDIWQQPMGYGTGLSSGRWLLTIAGDFLTRQGFGFNLPLLNGVLFLLMVALCAGLIVDMLKIENKASAALFGVFLAAFPAVTSVLFFKYTAVYYGISMLLAVLAAWVLQRGKWGLALSAIFIAMSCGIYQAYVPITVTLLVMILLRHALVGEEDTKRLFFQGVYYCVALILGILLYFVALKVSLAFYDTALSDYQGVDNMGKISLGALPSLLKRTLGSLCKMPIYDYCGLANIPLLKIAYILLVLVMGGVIIYLMFTRVRKPGLRLLTVLLCLVLPFALNFVVIMCPDTLIYTLMLSSISLMPCVGLVAVELLPQNKKALLVQKFMMVILSVMVFSYAYYANVNYTSMYFSNRQVENYMNTLVTQVRMSDGFTPDKRWALLGDISDPLMEESLYDGWRNGVTYGGNRFSDDLLNQYSRMNWVTHYLGYKIPLASEEEKQNLWTSEKVKAMPCWPSQGSIQVIGDTVVVKFQDLEQME